MKISSKRVALLAITLVQPFAAAADHRWEVGGGVSETERDAATSRVESEVAHVSASYFFDDVEDSSNPPALAAFLDPATRVSLAVSDDEQTLAVALPPGLGGVIIGGSGSSASVRREREVSDYSLGGQYLFPGSKWYAGGRYGVGNVDEPLAPPVVASSTDGRQHGLVAGKYFGSGVTRLELSLERSKSDSETTLDSCIFGSLCLRATTGVETTTDQVEVDVVHVRRFRSATYTLFGGIAEVDGRIVTRAPTLTATPAPTTGGVAGFFPVPPINIVPSTPIAGGVIAGSDFELDSVHTYSVGAELFPLSTIGVRLGYARFDGATNNDDAISVGASWFFRRNVGLEVTASRQEERVGSATTERVGLRVIGRL